MFPIKRMLSEKGHELLVINNYKFRRYRVTKKSGEMCWCCTKKSCRAKLFTVGADLKVTRQKLEHNHKPLTNELLSRQRMNNALARKAKWLEETELGRAQATDYSPDVEYVSNNFKQPTDNSASEFELSERVGPVDDFFEVVDVKVFPVYNMNDFNIGEYNIGFFGGGNMATAIATGILKKKVTTPNKIWVTSLTEETRSRWKKNLGVNTAANSGEIFNKCDIIILAVKPQVVDDALCQALNDYVIPNIPRKTFVISVLAGVTLESLSQKLRPFNPTQIIRTMPNTPLMVSEGITVYSYEPKIRQGSPGIEDKIVTSLFSTMGITEKVPEKLINPISALSGSGPAYVYLMIEALADGAVKMGVPRAMANTYAAQVMIGAGQMVLQTGKHPGLLKDEVCSPNGTTITGIHALECGGVRGNIMNAIEAATKRSNELSKLSH